MSKFIKVKSLLAVSVIAISAQFGAISANAQGAASLAPESHWNRAERIYYDFKIESCQTPSLAAAIASLTEEVDWVADYVSQVTSILDSFKGAPADDKLLNGRRDQLTSWLPIWTRELAQMKQWLQALKSKPPCVIPPPPPPPPPVTPGPSGANVPPHGEELIDTNDLMNGLPETPPVLADPRLDTPSDEPAKPNEIQPQVPKFDPPLHGFPQAPPLKTGSKPLDGLVDPPLKTSDEGAKPHLGMTAPRASNDQGSAKFAKIHVDAKPALRSANHETQVTTHRENFAAHTSYHQSERFAMTTGGFDHTARFGGAGLVDELSHVGHFAGFGRMGGDMAHFGGMGRMEGAGFSGGMSHMGGMNFLGGMGHMGRF
jgi:hypothetical protein